jgi:hypothetical protein
LINVQPLGNAARSNDVSLSDEEHEFYYAEIYEAVSRATFLTVLLVPEAVAFVSDKLNVN